MSKKPLPIVEVTLDRIIGGGQAIGTLEDGKKLLCWGGLPGEKVAVQLTKKKSSYVEGVVTEILTPSPQRITPHDPESYLSTSPWQLMDLDAEQHYKSALIEEAFELHDIVLPQPISIYTDGHQYEYRNKIEFSWWWDTEQKTLDLAFFRRGTHGKIPVQGTSLAHPSINQTAAAVRDILRDRGIEARPLKTLLVRSDSRGNTVFQLYVKDLDFPHFTQPETTKLPSHNLGFEIIYSNPKSPASVITERLQAAGQISLTDTIFDVPFNYATEGFFQINLPVYEQALRDMKEWVNTTKQVAINSPGIAAVEVPATSLGEDSAFPAAASQERELSQIAASEHTTPARVAGGGAAPASDNISDISEEGANHPTRLESSELRVDSIGINNDASGIEQDTKDKDWILNQVQNDKARGDSNESTDVNSPVVDLYSGVGTIGLTIGGNNVTLVEINEHAVREMNRNIESLGRSSSARAVLAASEDALEHITSDATIIVDPPRAGLHEAVIAKLLEAAPARIIYLSCNPVTQARDVMRLADTYGIRHHQGYNFFPRTPHIEHLVVLDKRVL